MSNEFNNKNGQPDEETANSIGVNGDAESDGNDLENDVAENEQLRQELDESKDQLLRLAAEFENFKKRMEREREILVSYAGENILRELLTTVDNLDRALEQGAAESNDAQQKLDALMEGVELTQKGLLATLEKFEVVPIESEGLEFDPSEHEAMTMAETDAVPPNHVVQQFAKGYRFKDRLLRPAKVVVSQAGK